LVRDNKYSRSLKLRKTGSEGYNLCDEGIHISENPDLLEKLKKGETITV